MNIGGDNRFPTPHVEVAPLRSLSVPHPSLDKGVKDKYLTRETPSPFIFTLGGS